MKSMFTVIAMMIGLSHAQPSIANNTWFLQGDSFFYTRLTLKEIAKFKTQESSVFTYGNHSNGGYGCGVAGFGKLKVEKMPQSFKTNLLLAYKQLHSSSKKDISVLIYNKTYDWKKHGIAIQYNENWVDETVAFDYLAESVRLESFLSDQKAMMDAWRDSKRIAPLKTTCPERPKEKGPKGKVKAKAKWIMMPVVLQSPFQMIVIPDRNFDDYHKYTMKKNQRLLVITDKGIESYIIKSKKWVRETPAKKLKDSK